MISFQMLVSFYTELLHWRITEKAATAIQDKNWFPKASAWLSVLGPTQKLPWHCV